MRRRAARFAGEGVALTVLATLAPFVAVRPAHACSCPDATRAEYFEAADVVFRGVVVDAPEPCVFDCFTRPGSPPTCAVVPFTIQTTAVFKGEVRALQAVGDTVCACDGYAFQAGSEINDVLSWRTPSKTRRALHR